MKIKNVWQLNVIYIDMALTHTTIAIDAVVVYRKYALFFFQL